MLLPQKEIFSWDDTTHMVVAQIAYDRLNDKTKKRVNQLVRKIRFRGRTYNFITIACWMDDLKEDPAYDAYRTWHYIDQPYFEGVPPRYIPLPSDNVLSRIQWATDLLKTGTASDERDAELLGFLIHLVADAHQPLHAISRYTRRNNDADGDRGGNEFRIITGIQRINNLHKYWDLAAGLFEFERIRRPLNSDGQRRIRVYAQEVASAYPPDKHAEWKERDPAKWVAESYNLARMVAYKTQEGRRLKNSYVVETQQVTRERIALAGYRLADLLNRIFGEG